MTKTYLDKAITIPTPASTVRTIVQADGIKLLPTYLKDADLADTRVFIITDSKVEPLYGKIVSGILSDANIPHSLMTIPAGEENKTLAQVGKAIDTLSSEKATRSDVLITLGGGVVGDLGGFVASIYNRGIPLVHIPTTLLAMVDSSIGGKTGVDHGGKNKTGSFYQPKIVLADPTVLKTLDQRTYVEGFGEIAKYAMLDAEFLTLLETNADRLVSSGQHDMDMLSEIIARCVTQKSTIIQADPLEQNVAGRVLLNYGHTLAHALEAAGDYAELLHGEAVAIGMSYAVQLAAYLNMTDETLVDRQLALLTSLQLPTSYSGQAQIDTIIEHMMRDKKNETSDVVRFVLPKQPGNMVLHEVNKETLHITLDNFLNK